MACGYFLHRDHAVTLYEQNDYVGGHTNTVSVEEDGREVYIDTGFMVYNEVTYPNLTRLFGELNVPTRPTSMSFSVQHVPSGLEFCGSGLDGLFAQRKNIYSPSFIALLRQVNRFNKQSLEVLENKQFEHFTLAEYAEHRGYSNTFLQKYLIPMSSAVWSTPPDLMLDFPAVTLVRFFKNHGFLGLNSQHQWRTVVEGSKTYRDLLIAPFLKNIRLGDPAMTIKRERGRATVTTRGGDAASYDRVILACHGDQALRLLNEPTAMERSLLGSFRYQENLATLHTDDSVMPKKKRAWSSWNYRIDAGRDGLPAPSTVYYMNSLQQVSTKKAYFVSINDPGNIHPAKVLKEIKYEHPLFSLAAIAAQTELNKLNENTVVNFCGSYFKYGFHEDALTSAIELCGTITHGKTWSDGRPHR